jgi:hypothetical protein
VTVAREGASSQLLVIADSCERAVTVPNDWPVRSARSVLEGLLMKKSTKPTRAIGLQLEHIRPITVRALPDDQLQGVNGGTVIGPSNSYAPPCHYSDRCV